MSFIFELMSARRPILFLSRCRDERESPQYNETVALAVQPAIKAMSRQSVAQSRPVETRAYGPFPSANRCAGRSRFDIQRP